MKINTIEEEIKAIEKAGYTIEKEGLILSLVIRGSIVTSYFILTPVSKYGEFDPCSNYVMKKQYNKTQLIEFARLCQLKPSGNFSFCASPRGRSIWVRKQRIFSYFRTP